jgi:hypothetical protein
MEMAVHAFEKTRIHLFNRNVFTDKNFAPLEVTFCPGVQENQVTVEDTFQ